MRIEFNVFFAFLIMVWCIYKTVLLWNQKKIGKQIEFSKDVTGTLFFLYILVLIDITMFPIEIGYTGKRYMSYNIVPFKSIYGLLHHSWYMVPFRNLVGIILLFAPLGLFVPIKWRKINKLRKMILIGFFISLFIETLQLSVLHRSADIDDIILNTIGTVIGYLAFHFVKKLLMRNKRNEKALLSSLGMI